ncbi:golvesin C-terminal-like domain-containing protein [Streptomyces sp. GQFP]|uniref:golvesin C-terminal-like domain-containing protein n=1 Tax=Streptomyces sp. GQFP TaxID=2907545 RepID=UPI001F20B976|nr:exo-alpha-sialidase [Streptomyces sp. GQFP]UIX29689.1 exo-alpha-sialidase [Streptomyces sp. GQFP]
MSLLVSLALSAPQGTAEPGPIESAAAAAADAGSFAESELWDSTDADGYASFHVQGLTVIPAGTVPPAGDGQALAEDVVLTFAEGRPEKSDAGPKDLVVRRSVDAGRTWSASVPVVPTDPDHSWGNPTPVVDEQTGRVCLFYKGSGGTIFVKRSDDAGASWSAPEELTSLFSSAPNPYGWTLNSPSPGHGIQLRNGRLLIPVQHRAPDPDPDYGIDMLYSDAHGDPGSWRRSARVPVSVSYPVNESRVYERGDGAIVLNGRWGSGGTRYRITATSTDGGESWSAPVIDGSTGQFVSVDASVLQYSRDPVDRVLFSRPDASARENMTVSVSYDQGASYRYSRVINPGASYYSDLARLSDGTILLVYGRDGADYTYPERVSIARFDLEWLTKGRDSLATGPGLSRHEYELATAQARTDTGAAAPVVSDANARGGRTLRYTAPEVGDYVDVPFDVTAAGTYEVAVRLQRRADAGQLRASIDGTALSQGLIDPTATVGEGYQLYRLGTVPLAAGSHSIRFALAGQGHGGGSVVTADQLLLTSGGHPSDAPKAVADNDFGGGFEVVSGTWPRVEKAAGEYGQSHRTHAAGTGTAKVRFRPDVPMSGVYEVSAWFPPGTGRASNASYVIRHAEGQSTVAVDQRSEGGRWVRLGDFAFSGGGGGTIELTDAADGTVAADAVRLAYRGAVADNDSAEFDTVSGEWNNASGVAGYYGPNYRTRPAGTGSAVVRWRLDVPADGAYDVAVRYTAHTNRASNAPYVVNHADGSTVIPVDQRERGGQWVSLGNFRFTPGQPATIELSDAADGYVVADAVRTTHHGVVADNDDASRYEVVSGEWNKATGVAGSYGPTYRTRPAGTGGSVVRWRLEVPTSGRYEVAVWFTAHTNRASNAPYVVNHADGSTVIPVDQRERGGQWVSLGSFRFTPGQPATVELSDAADGYVVADAVRLIE